MTTLEAAIPTESPRRARTRFLLATSNAVMAAIVAGLTLGATAAAIAAAVMFVVTYLPGLWRTMPETVQANLLAVVGALFILCVLAGTIVFGIQVAFGVALVLAPSMLFIICLIALGNSL